MRFDTPNPLQHEPLNSEQRAKEHYIKRNSDVNRHTVVRSTAPTYTTAISDSTTKQRCNVEHAPTALVENPPVDVLIIGAGWSGLLACKHAIQERLSVVVLESRSDLGGVWRFSADKSTTTVMTSTRTSSSSTVTEMSDYPMPDAIGDFPTHDNVLKYLDDYAREFDLRRHIVFGSQVQSVRKEGAVWRTRSSTNQMFSSRHVIVCSGVHQRANRQLESDLLKSFTGELLHAGEIKEFRKEHAGKRLLVIGGGETASDIIEEYHAHAQKITWSVPRGQHFFRKYAKILPYRKPQALDKASSRALKFISPQTKSKPGMAWVCRWTTNGSLLAYQGHGIPEFRNSAVFFHNFINKQAQVLDLIDYDHVTPKGAVTDVKGNTATFVDGTSVEADVIIQCTGYTVEFPYLPTEQRDVRLTDRYKFVFDVDDPTIAFVGFVRPIVGSIPSIAEMQARWVCGVLSGRLQLADVTSRRQAVTDDNEFWRSYFAETSQRIDTLVDGYTYLDDVAKLSDCYPNYWQLLWNSPRDWLTAVFSPYNGCSYLLNEESMREKALRNLRKHGQNTTNPLHLLLILILRILMFDWFLGLFANVKFAAQTSTTLKRVRETKLVRCLDYVWTAPKRFAFDNKSKLH